jgi:NAD(P)-dependent dehydrogenase (short-subunit alcohol dehydrogenase family)
VARTIEGAGGEAIFVHTDVTSQAAVVEMVRATVSTFGGLDVAVNCAGTPGTYSTAQSCSDAVWDAVLDLNLRAMWWCLKHELNAILDRGGGAIVNIASRAGDSASPKMFPYVTTKHGVVGMTKSAAVDFAPHNVRVNALLPGFTDTPMFRAGQRGGSLIAAGGLADRIPMRRVAQPEEQAEVAVWLCSDRASYITGTTVVADGGKSAAI